MDQQPSLEWGCLVETLRILRGWSQEQLAKASGVDKTTLSKYENAAHAEGHGKGRVSRPQREARAKIEEAFGIEGRSREVEIYLGELRERLIAPERRGPAGGIERAAAAAARRMEAALWLGLESRGGGDGEPGLAWGVLIATLRTLLGWNQEDLARKAGVHVSTVSRQEMSTADPSRIVREKLKHALGLQEGMVEEVQIEIGGLRAMMLAPKRPVVRAGIERAGNETARFMEKALRLGLEDLRRLGEGETAPLAAPSFGEDE